MKKITILLLLLFMGLTVLNSNMIIADAEEVESHTEEEQTTISMDMYDPIKGYTYESPIEMYNNYLYWEVTYLAEDYNTSTRQEIVDNYPDVNIILIDEFINENYQLGVELGNKFAGFEEKYQQAGYLGAELYSELLAAIYTYRYDAYSKTAAFITEHGDFGDSTGFVVEYLLRSIDISGMHLSLYSYQALLHYDNDFITATYDLTVLEPIYDEVYRQVSAIYSDPDEINKKVSKIIEDSIRAWIYEVDIDYFIAYQAQVQLYLQNLKEMGYVWDNANETMDLSINVSDQRELILGDLKTNGAGWLWLATEFLEVNLTADGTAFLSPEEVYQSEYIQEIIEQYAMYSFDPEYSNDENFYSKESVLNHMIESIYGQYNAISMPGSSQQPILSGFHSILYGIVDNYKYTGTLPELTPWIEAGNTLPVYDQYRILNYTKVPYINIKEETVKEVTRTITYLFEDGTVAHESVLQNTEFRVEKELISGLVSSDIESVTFPAVSNPIVSHSDDKVIVLEANQIVEELVVTKDSENIEITVTYPLEHELTVYYMDETGNHIQDSNTISGRWNTQYVEVAPEIVGYELVEISSTNESSLARTTSHATGTYGIDKEDIIFVYKETEVKDEEQNPTPSPTNPEGTPPNTGVNSSIGWYGMIVIMSGFMLLSIKREKSNKSIKKGR